VGDRGVGKSFWSSVLKDDAARTAISPIYPRLGLDKLSVALGFSEVIAQTGYPSARILRSLIESKLHPDLIWRSVILTSINPTWHPENWKDIDWAARCKWIESNPEKEERMLSGFNHKLVSEGRTHLVVFDALDRLGNSWQEIRLLTKALLTVALDMRSFTALRAKIFIRPDMESDREIWSIRDGSKLKLNIVNLNWNTQDLYGFVWHWFLLEPGTSNDFAALVKKLVKAEINIVPGEHLIEVPPAILEDEENQKKLFEVMSGKMMGAGTRKGHPYTWIPKHLADARGKVSLRSFIIALRIAASNTPTSAATSMTYDNIKRGVQQASHK